MESTLTWTGGRTFVGTTEAGHSIVLGTAHENTPKPGPSPMELVLFGAGGCSAWDVIDILEKGRQAVDDVRVELSAERAETVPKVFTKIHLHFVVEGRGVAESKVARAIQLSAEKYCSATRMLGATAEITHDFEIIERG